MDNPYCHQPGDLSHSNISQDARLWHEQQPQGAGLSIEKKTRGLDQGSMEGTAEMRAVERVQLTTKKYNKLPITKALETANQRLGVD